MKRLLLIIIPLALIGGAVYGMKQFGIPPFKKPAKKVDKAASTAKAGAKKPAEPVQVAAAPPAEKKDTPAPPVKKPVKHPQQEVKDPHADELAEAQITRLSAVYEGMPAEEAGKIFAKLPDPLVEKLLRRMDERQVGKLLLALDVQRAAKITESLAKTKVAN